MIDSSHAPQAYVQGPCPVWEQHIHTASSLSFNSLLSSLTTGVPSLRDVQNTLRMIQIRSQKHEIEVI